MGREDPQMGSTHKEEGPMDMDRKDPQTGSNTQEETTTEKFQKQKVSAP